MEIVEEYSSELYGESLAWLEAQLVILNTYGLNQYSLYHEKYPKWEIVPRAEIKWVENRPFYQGIPVAITAYDELEEEAEVEYLVEEWESWEIGCFCQ